MNSHINYILARQRVADLQRAAARGRLAAQARAARRSSRTSAATPRRRGRLAVSPVRGARGDHLAL